MRKSLVKITIVLLMVVMACTHNSRNSKSEPSSSAASNTLSSAVSNSQDSSRPISQMMPSESLNQAVKSEITSALASTAFNSVCQTSVSPEKAKKCLYYRVNNDIYQFCFPERTKKLIYSIPKNLISDEKNEVIIKIAGDHIIWQSGSESFSEKQKLFIWDGEKQYSIRLDQNPLWDHVASNYEDANFTVTSFLISPNGECIIWNTNGITESSNDPSVRVPDFENMANIVYASKIGSQDQKEVLRQTYMSQKFHDNKEEKQLLGWSKINPSMIYLTTKFERQLYGGHSDLISIDFKSGRGNSLNYDGDLLAFSPDEMKFAYTPNDETCCGGDANYTNNSVTIWDKSSDKQILIFDEWKEFGKSDEHYPFNAAFSPDGNLIAISISGSKHFTTLRRVSGIGKPFNLNERFVIGWLDQSTLILGKRDWRDYKHPHKVQDLFIFDLKIDKEESLMMPDVTYLDFE